MRYGDSNIDGGFSERERAEVEAGHPVDETTDARLELESLADTEPVEIFADVITPDGQRLRWISYNPEVENREA